MPERYTCKPPVNEDDLNALIKILGVCFNIPDDQWAPYAGLVGQENFRLLRDAADRLAGGLALVPMGQFFGGRSVPMTGISAVGIAPAHRGRGAARALMERTLLELHAQGCPLSALYPATQTLYRAVGYEQAGGQYEITIPLNVIDANERELTLRAIEEHDHDVVAALYRAEAIRHNGTLDRGPFAWGRVRKPRGKTASGYIVERDGRAEGYLYIVHDDISGLGYDVRATDFIAVTPEAGLRLLTFLADHRSVGRNATLFRAPNDPLLALPAEQVYGVKLLFHWFLRIVDVRAALEARGYHETVTTEVHLRVHDDLIRSNNGDFVLHVEGGRGRVSMGGEGRLNLDVRGLAMLYSGHRSPMQMLGTGLLRATEAHARDAAPVFAGSYPWMPDRF